MRLLHTSDWHLGRSLHRADLSEAQERFVDHLVDLVRAEAVDAVLVAGDVYDRAIPPLASIGLFEDALLRLRDTGATVVAISGNHDSPQRLGVNGSLLAKSGVHLRTRLTDVARPILLTDRNSEDEVAVYALPYLEPDAVRAELAAACGREVTRSHADVVGTALALSAADRAGRDPARTVLLAHGWVTGAQPSESERDISVGGVGAVPASLFEGFGYAAFGHLHRPQRITERLRYSGSALPYSFSEADQQKGSWLVDLAAPASAVFVPTPTQRRLTCLRGELDELLSSREHVDREGDYLAITLTDVVRPVGAMERLRVRFPDVLMLSWEPASFEKNAPSSYRDLVRGRSDLDVALDFVEHVRNAPADPAERDLLDQALTAVRREDDAA